MKEITINVEKFLDTLKYHPDLLTERPDKVEHRIKDILKDCVPDAPDQDIIKVRGYVLLKKRKWYALFKRGWHRHTDMWGKPWWIRYRW